jgi:hypothetical protein
MKLKFACLTATLALLLSCGTTTTTTSDNEAFAVPAAVSKSFTTQYPNATNVVWSAYDVATAPIVDWELTGWSPMDARDYMVTFTVDGQNYYGWYEDTGNWIGSAYVISDYNTLPEAITTTINTKFAGYSIDRVQREFWKDHIAYEIKLKKSDDDKVKLLLDANGNIIKQKDKD